MARQPIPMFEIDYAIQQEIRALRNRRLDPHEAALAGRDASEQQAMRERGERLAHALLVGGTVLGLVLLVVLIVGAWG